MIKKKDNHYQNIKSFIAEGVELKGQLFSTGSIRVDGVIDGELDVKGDLVVGNTGVIKGEVKVENIMLSGKLEGNLAASGKVEISSSGQMIGDVKCHVFTIEEGGVIDGTTKMSHVTNTVEAVKKGLKKDRE